MNMPEIFDENLSVQEFWELNHERKIANYKYWLTGSEGLSVWTQLFITDRILPNKVILNIGVGLGVCTRDLAKRGCIVHALDISKSALKSVEHITAQTWLPSDLQKIPENTFDLAISKLVAQHMADKDLEEQISGVIRCLKPCGIFAIQFAFSFDSTKNDLGSVPNSTIKCGGVLRSPLGFNDIVAKAGGIVLWDSQIRLYPELRVGWHVSHIVRKDYKA